MTFSDFNSLFELFVVFNLAYIFSENFQEILNATILKPSEYLSGKAEEAKAKKDTLEVTVKELTINPGEAGGVSNAAIIEQARIELQSIHESYMEINRANENNISLLKITSGFSTISLFSAFYCIAILFVGGLIKLPVKLECLGESIFMFNAFYILFILIIFIRDLIPRYRDKSIVHSFTLLLLIFVVILAISFYLLLHFHCGFNRMYFSHFLATNISNNIVLFSIMLPIVHFLAYFLRAFVIYIYYYISTRKMLREYDQKLTEFDEQNIETARKAKEYILKCDIVPGQTNS